MREILAQFFSYLRATWRKRWYAILAAWLICIIGWVVVWRMPDRYEATARVYVDTQSVLRPLLSGLAVQPNVDQQIAMVTRTLISRPNLEKVARMTDLDLNAKTTSDMENLVLGLAARISLMGAGQDNLYTINYQHSDPDTAKRVVQALLTIFVESSLGDKRKDSDSARRFIEEQIQAYEQKLIAAEDRLKEFKRANIGMMPGGNVNYFERLGEAAGNLSQAKLALSEEENRRNEIKKQLSGDEPVLLADPVEVASPEVDGRIQNLNKQLDALRLKYTEQHPDIIGTKRIIAQLEEQKAQEAKKRKPSTSAGTGQSAFSQQLSLALAESEANVASLKARVAEYENRYAQLRAASNALPQVEADFTQLNRDYEVNKSNYEKLLSRRETAQISEDMEAKKGVLDFRIIDPPRVSLTPSGPNRPLLISVVLLLGIGVGAAVAFLLSQLKHTVEDRHALKQATNLPVLGTVSMVWTTAQKTQRRRGLVAYWLTFLSLLGTYGAVLVISMLAARTS